MKRIACEMCNSPELLKEDGVFVCQSCGTKYTVEEAKKMLVEGIVTIDNSENVRDYLDVAKKALSDGNGSEAFNFVTKALEMNPKSSEAWILKMEALHLTSAAWKPKTTEIISCGDNAIEYAISERRDSVKAEVYKKLLKYAHDFLIIIVNRMSDTEQLINLITAYGTLSDEVNNEVITDKIYTSLSQDVLDLRTTVPDEAISKSVELQMQVIAIAQEYINFSNSNIDRLAMCRSLFFADEIVNTRKNNLARIKEGLPQEVKNSIGEELLKSIVSNTKSTNLKIKRGNGCYIATSIYGSYDCPQVWTLRRYRDEYLDRFWYGRAFIWCYYTISPIIVKQFGRMEWFSSFSRRVLNVLVENLKKRHF